MNQNLNQSPANLNNNINAFEGNEIDNSQKNPFVVHLSDPDHSSFLNDFKSLYSYTDLK